MNDRLTQFLGFQGISPVKNLQKSSCLKMNNWQLFVFSKWRTNKTCRKRIEHFYEAHWYATLVVHNQLKKIINAPKIVNPKYNWTVKTNSFKMKVSHVNIYFHSGAGTTNIKPKILWFVPSNFWRTEILLTFWF